MRRLPLLISLGMLAACGEGASVPEKDSGVPAPGNEVAGSAPQAGNTAPVPTAEAAGGDATATNSAAADAAHVPAAAESEAKALATLASLPLKRGFYVSGDTSCGQASNATLMLVKRDGINSSRVPCEFKKIEKTGPTSYRVTETCTEGGAAWGQEDQVSTNVSTYQIKSDTAFTAKSEGGWEISARYCAQPSLPEPWRNNDIADIVN